MKYYPEDIEVSVPAVIGHLDGVLACFAAGRLLTEAATADLEFNKEVLRKLGGDVWAEQKPATLVNSRDYQLGRIAGVQAMNDTVAKAQTGFRT